MKITREEMPPCQAVLNIEMEPEDLERYLDRAHRTLVQRVSVPGFRKGKAPRSTLERIVGRDALLREAMESLVPDVTAQAVKEQAPEAVAQPDVEVVSLEPLAIKATVPLPPTVGPGDYRSIRIPRDPVVLDEAEVDRALEELRSDAAPWEPAEHPLQMGDLAVMDLVGEAGGKDLFNTNDAQYVVSEEPQPVSGFGQALVGGAAGETREFDLDLPEDFPDDEVAGTPCHFSVTVKEVKEKRLPDLSDEFANGVGQGYDTVEELRQDIRKRLRDSQERESKRNHEGLVMDHLLETATVELPPLMIDREVEHVIADIQEGVERQVGRRVTLDEYVAAVQKTPEELREEMRPQAITRLKRIYILDHLAEMEGIHITEEDTDSEIESLAQGSGAQGEQLLQVLRQPQNRDSITRNLRPQRTLERIAAMARGEADEPPGDEDATEEGR